MIARIIFITKDKLKCKELYEFNPDNLPRINGMIQRVIYDKIEYRHLNDEQIIPYKSSTNIRSHLITEDISWFLEKA